MFIDKKINIEIVNMLSIRLGRGHFNERFQHLHKNLHILLQSQDVAPKALVGPNSVVCKVKENQTKKLMQKL
jgi:hypothetical protein